MRIIVAKIKDNIISFRWILVCAFTIGLVYFHYATAFRPVWQLPRLYTFLDYTLLFNTASDGNLIYLILLPFLAALGGGSLYAVDKLSNRLTFVASRVFRKKFLQSNIVASFLLGSFSGSLPFWVTVIIGLIKEPHMHFVSGLTRQNPYGGDYPIILSDSWVYKYYESNQKLLFIVVCLYLTFLCGLFSVLSLLISCYVRVRYIELIIPFVFSYLVYLLDGVLDTGISLPIYMYLTNSWYRYSEISAYITPIVLLTCIAVLYFVEIQRETL